MPKSKCTIQMKAVLVYFRYLDLQCLFGNVFDDKPSAPIGKRDTLNKSDSGAFDIPELCRLATADFHNNHSITYFILFSYCSQGENLKCFT